MWIFLEIAFETVITVTPQMRTYTLTTPSNKTHHAKTVEYGGFLKTLKTVVWFQIISDQ